MKVVRMKCINLRKTTINYIRLVQFFCQFLLHILCYFIFIYTLAGLANSGWDRLTVSDHLYHQHARIRVLNDEPVIFPQWIACIFPWNNCWHKKKKGKVKENKCVLSTWTLPTIWNNCYELICCLLQIAVNICVPNRCSPCFGGLFPNYPHMLYSLCEFHIANFHPSGFFFPCLLLLHGQKTRIQLIF